MDRRRFLTGISAIGLSISAGIVGNGGFGGQQANLDQGDLIQEGPTVALEPIATGVGFPVDLVAQPEADRRYIVTQMGQIYVYESDGIRETPFLDIGERIETNGEKGLLGMALHPRFASNQKVYVRYSAPRPDGKGGKYQHISVLSEFKTTENYQQIRPDTERYLLNIPNPHPYHNGGDIIFGPDEYLYISLGDGGRRYGQGPGRADDWYDWNMGGNGQEVSENLFGSILRIDVDGQDGTKPYAIPDDNPLVGEEGLDEHFAWGFRNPWRMSFNDGELFVGDVGKRDYEEINIVHPGGNYGWNVREGPMCLNLKSPRIFPSFPLPWCPEETPDGDPLIDPIIHYPHAVRTENGVVQLGSAVVGGYVYQKDNIPGLTDTYVFGDFSSPEYGSGRLFVAERPDNGEKPWKMKEIMIAGTESGRINGALLGFGRDQQGDLYVLKVAGEGGTVARLVPEHGGTSG